MEIGKNGGGKPPPYGTDKNRGRPHRAAPTGRMEIEGCAGARAAGENAEAPPVADAARLFQGSGTFSAHYASENVLSRRGQAAFPTGVRRKLRVVADADPYRAYGNR